jgi:ABC-2 type transport system ATP-binding protein
MMQGNESAGPLSEAHVLIADDLRKSYGGRHALRGLSFALARGHVLGFLGPNGAGKTTSIRILTTILQPSAGRFTVDGISSDDPVRIRPRIGVLPETLGLPNQITGIEYISYFGRLYGHDGVDTRKHGLALLDLVGLRDRATHLIRTYSHGMRQRLGIARALVNDPVVLFLDEPTLGLDPRGQQELNTLLRGIARDRGVGVVLCSHVLSEVEGVCDDVVILSSGRVVAAGSVAEVLSRAQEERSGRDSIRLRVPGSSVARTTEVLQPLPSVARLDGGNIDGELHVDLVPNGRSSSGNHRASNEVLAELVRAGIPVLGFEIEGGRLQDAFLQLTEGEQA